MDSSSGESLTMSVREAARLLGIGRDSAYSLVRQGVIPVIRVGRRLLVPRAALVRWVERQAEQRGPAGAVAGGEGSRIGGEGSLKPLSSVK